MPCVYDVFIDSDSQEFFDHSLGSHFSILHTHFAPSLFHASMTVLDVLSGYGIDTDAHLRSRAFVILGMTALDMHYVCPCLRAAQRPRPPTRKVDFYFAHRAGNNIFTVRVCGADNDALGLYLKAALLMACDHNTQPLGRHRATDKLVRTCIQDFSCAPADLPWG
jgi:hypothetical protein